MVVRDYPFDRLPHLSRDQVRALPGLRRALAAVRLPDLCGFAGPLLGLGQLRASAQPPRLVPRATLPGQLAGPLVALLLVRDAGGDDERFAIECSTASAAWLADRMLGSDGSAALALGAAPLDPMSVGVLAYLAARVIAAGPSAFLLRAVLTTTHEIVDALGDEVLVAPIRLDAEGHALTLRALVPSALLRCAPEPTAATTASAWLHGVALTLWTDCGHATLPLTAARSLVAGDVVVLDNSGLVHEAGTFRGSVVMRVQGSNSSLTASAREREIIVEQVDGGASTIMTTGKIIPSRDEPTRAPGSALADDAPIELCVELARFTLTLGELSRLHAGDVLTTGRRIGEAVTLRAGTRALAEGELVDVEGEIGLRVLRVIDQSAIV